MHLIETYALATGSKIKKPFIIKKYYPLPTDKYITIQNSSGMEGKCYDHFQDIVDFLYKVLNENGYQIIQIGSEKDRPLKHVVHLQGKTNINQTAFILENSKLHIGNDSFAVHMASGFNTPLIGLYSVSSPEIAGPYWKTDKQICLTPQNWKPSFNPNESPKRVNEIKIEEIVNAVFRLLFNKNVQTFETKYMGKHYQNKLIECFPDQVFSKEQFENVILNIRFDYKDTITTEDYQKTSYNLQFKKCTILTDKVLQFQYFLPFKQNIESIIYDITENIDLNFITDMLKMGLKCNLMFRLNNNQNILTQRKLETINLPMVINTIESQTLDEKSLKDSGETYYKSNKILFANGKAYISKSAQEEDQALSNIYEPLVQKLDDIKNINSLIKYDLDNIFIFQKPLDSKNKN